MNTTNIAHDIINGTFDSALDDIANALKQRRHSLSFARAASLRPGDKVRIGETVRPKYLAGLTATVTGLSSTRALIEFDDTFAAGRFADGCRVPFDLIEKVDGS